MLAHRCAAAARSSTLLALPVQKYQILKPEELRASSLPSLRRHH
jgi:hypothetical protein